MKPGAKQGIENMNGITNKYHSQNTITKVEFCEEDEASIEETYFDGLNKALSYVQAHGNDLNWSKVPGGHRAETNDVEGCDYILITRVEVHG